ncbi:peptidylprolyl isomerase [Synergistaceae bacterium OttesenSCG-928-D05]|nr:peptidylprolyl isomerase [Synergistaceae bacterium OttesenSCG-928-D05]
MFAKKIIRLVIFTVLIMAFTLPAFAADSSPNKPILTVGSSTMNAQEIFQMLVSSAGGNEMMAAMILSQSTLEERTALVQQMADALVFAEAAKALGYDKNPDIAMQIKWQTTQLLVQAYFNAISTKWDFSDTALRKYYNAHKEEFVQAPASRTRHILSHTQQDSMNVAMKLLETGDFEAAALEYSRDPNSARNGGDLGWVEKGMLVGPVEDAIESAVPGSVTGPVQSDFGWHLIKVEERRPEKQLSFEEAGDEVPQRLQRYYIDQEIQKLRKDFTVTVDTEALENLGGVPAPAPSK